MHLTRERSDMNCNIWLVPRHLLGECGSFDVRGIGSFEVKTYEREQLLYHQDEKPHIMLRSLLYYICTINERASILVSSKLYVLEARKLNTPSYLANRDCLQLVKLCVKICKRH